MGNNVDSLPKVQSPPSTLKPFEDMHRNEDALPKFGPSNTSNIGPSGFRVRVESPGIDISATELSEMIHITEEVYVYGRPSEDAGKELQSEAKKLAIHHGFINGDYQYIEQQNILEDIADKYKYIKQLGFGASCRVLLVQDTKSNTKYALKELIVDDEYNPMCFKKEIKLLSMLDHPNILKYHESYIDPHNFYIATQYCHGGDLFQRLQQSHKFTERCAAQMIHTIIDAVAYLHEKGMILIIVL